MTEKIVLDMLTSNSVSVMRQNYVTVEDVEYPLGEPWRKAYVNSTFGRTSAQSELPQAQQDAIFAIWGDTDTVAEPVA